MFSNSATALLDCPILVVDDSTTVRQSLLAHLRTLGYRNLMEATNGDEALSLVLEHDLDLMLLDIDMPVLGGLDVLDAMRVNPKTQDLPVIVISGLDQAETAVSCIELGAQDVLHKPFNPILLKARVHACLEKRRLLNLEHRRLQELQFEKDQLEAIQRRLDQELAEAARYVRGMLPEPATFPFAIHWLYRPCHELGGDAFGYHWLDEDHFALYLLDVCGHGVGASLLAVSALNTIRFKGLDGVDFRNPGAVLTGLSRAFPMEKHGNMYFTLWYGVYQVSTRTLRHGCGGHPPAFLLHPDQTIHEIRESGVFVGLASDRPYRVGETAVPPGAWFFLYSDGAFEVANPNGEQLGFDAFRDFIRAEGTAPNALSRLEAVLEQFHGPGPLNDDLSLVRFHFP